MKYIVRDSMGKNIYSVESNSVVSNSISIFDSNLKNNIVDIVKAFESTQTVGKNIISEINKAELLGVEANILQSLSEKIKSFFKSMGDWFKKCFKALNTSKKELDEIQKTPKEKKLKGSRPTKINDEYFKCDVIFSNNIGVTKKYKKITFKVSDFDSIFNNEADRLINTITEDDIKEVFEQISKYNSRISEFLKNIGNKKYIETNKIDNSYVLDIAKAVDKCFISKNKITDRQEYLIYILNELDLIVNSLSSGYLKDASDWLSKMDNVMKTVEEDAINGRMVVSKEAIAAINKIHKQINSIVASVVSLIRTIVIIYGKLENEMIKIGKKRSKIMEKILTGTENNGKNANILMKYDDHHRLSYLGRFIIGTSYTYLGSDYINNIPNIMYLSKKEFDFVNDTFLRIYKETGTYKENYQMFSLSGKYDSPIYKRSNDSKDFKKAMTIILNSSINGKILGEDNYETYGHYIDYQSYNVNSDNNSKIPDFEILTIEFNFILYEKTIIPIKETDVLYHTSPTPNLKTISGFYLSGDSFNHYATERVYFNLNEPIHRAGDTWDFIYECLQEFETYKAAKVYVYAVKNPENYIIYKDPLLSFIDTCVYIDSKSVEVEDVTSKFPIITKINEYLTKHPNQEKKTQ